MGEWRRQKEGYSEEQSRKLHLTGFLVMLERLVYKWNKGHREVNHRRKISSQMITDPRIGFAGYTVKTRDCLEKSVFILELLHLFRLFFGYLQHMPFE